MKNIVLICTAGMSTSLLVKKMQDSAEKRGIEANIWAVGDVDSYDATQKADVILLGPQVGYLLNKTKEIVKGEKPVAVIGSLIYGTMNGEKALDFALEELENFKK